jgi:probable F420-dependent oxidoreductase
VTRLGLTLPFDGTDLPGARRRVEALPDLGYTDLWSLETAGFDAFTPLAVAAGWGTPLRLGTAVAGVFTRGPALLAMQAAALADAAPGRFVLGLGSASPTIVSGWNDLPFERPVARMRDTLRFLGRAFTGERVDEAWPSFRVSGFRLERPPAEPPPIFLAALGPRMLRLAAREAGGVLLGMTTPEDAARLLRDLDPPAGRPFEVVARVGVHPTDDLERARRRARAVLATYLNVPAYARLYERLGHGERLAPLRRAFAAGDRAAALAAVPDEWVDGVFVHGSPEACVEKLRAFRAAGVTTLVLAVQPPGGDVDASLRILGRLAR